MSSALVLTVVLALFAAAYRVYGRILSKNFGLDASRQTPAHTLNDGVDYVPAKSWWVLFGHHFSSICGAGPIVGPALACAYWGWGAGLVWIVVGAVLMGAVADFSSLVLSMREKGKSISEISGAEISPLVRVCFSVFLWISLILVIAVFSIFGAKTFVEEPYAVLPSFGLIPTAVLTGWLLYRTRVSNWLGTLLGILILCLLLWGGTALPITLPGGARLDPETVWILILLVYCFIASVVPVQFLLQPRDYLASFILFGVIAIGLGSILATNPAIQVPALTAFVPSEWPKAGPLWPMLFVTIACGAISGFHSLVSSGTTCKQIASESHACRIGYGGMLLEAVVGVMVLLAVSAGLSQKNLGDLLRTGGPISAFSHGYGNLSSFLLGDYGKALAVLGLNAFILTTLDTATRITRYITAEILGLKNIYLATFFVVAASAGLALTGKWGLLWPAFGASNQLIAGMALLLASCWLYNRGKKFRFTLLPAFFMLVTTVGAFGYQLYAALTRTDAGGSAHPDWTMTVLCVLLLILSGVIFLEGLRTLRNPRTRPAAGAA